MALEKSIKIKIAISIIWFVLTALMAGGTAEGYGGFQFGTFLGVLVVLNLPALIYWLGFWIWGNGYIWRVVKNSKRLLAIIVGIFVSLITIVLIGKCEGMYAYLFPNYSERALRNVEALHNILGLIFGVVVGVKAYQRIYFGKAKLVTGTPAVPSEKRIYTHHERITAYGLIAFSLIVATIVSLIYYTDITSGLAYQFGQLIGTALITYLLAVLINRFFFRDKKDIALIFAVCFFLVTSINSYDLWSEKKTSTNATRAMAEVSQRDLTAALTGETSNAKLEGDFGELTPLMEIVSEARQESSELRKVLTDEAAKYGEDLFSSQNLSSMEKMEELKQRLVQSAERIQKLSEQYEKVFDRVESKLQRSNLSQSIRDQAVESFKKAKVQRVQDYKEFMAVEAALFYKMAEIMEFYQQRAGQFEITKDGPLFATDADVNAYNAHSIELHQLAARESELSNKMVAQEMKFIETMNKNAK